jgi:Zn-dependent protease with chaperone function
MNFFEAQDAARRSTTRLVLMFAAAVIGIVLLTNLLIAFIFAYGEGRSQEALFSRVPPELLLYSTLGVILLITGGSLYKMLQLRSGGQVVAESLGGRLISQNSGDLLERKVLNVVEEMAIASGSPVPPVYLLDESGINAFAAGWSPADAVIGVTRGTIENLTRDELQGVIAHEFSHIFNGDMRINIRLIGILHGILLLGMIGYFILRSAGRSRSRSSKGGGGGILLLGLGLMVVGYIGTFFGQMIKATISRQRELLADASAVQFTRNREGIANALKKIGGFSAGSTLLTPAAAEFSHAYFANGIAAGLQSVFATHPPLEYRIKQIQPDWDGRFITPKPRVSAAAEDSDKQTDEDKRHKATMIGTAILGGTVAAGSALNSIAQIGQPGEAHIGYAQRLIGTIPPPILDEARDPYGARALIFALVIEAGSEQTERQWAIVQEQVDGALYYKTRALSSQITATDARLRLPLIDLALPSLKSLSTEQYGAFKETLLALIRADKKIMLAEWVLQRLVLQHLDQAFGLRQRPRARYSMIGDVKHECEIVLSLIAHVEHTNNQDITNAFNAGKKASGLGALQPVTTSELSLKNIDEALDKLEQLKSAGKLRFLQSCAGTINSDNQSTARGIELLRTIASCLDCPMPPVIAAE